MIIIMIIMIIIGIMIIGVLPLACYYISNNSN